MTHVLKLTNGLTVLAEELPGLRTAAFAMSLPAGCRHEPKDRLGLASVTCEMVQRGAGPRDSREIMGELDLLGVDRNASISSPHTTFSAAMPAESFADALAIYADIVRSPHLPADQFEDAQRGSLLELQAAADDLAGRAIQTAKLMQYGDPIGRDPLGDEPACWQRPSTMSKNSSHAITSRVTRSSRSQANSIGSHYSRRLKRYSRVGNRKNHQHCRR